MRYFISIIKHFLCNKHDNIFNHLKLRKFFARFLRRYTWLIYSWIYLTFYIMQNKLYILQNTLLYRYFIFYILFCSITYSSLLPLLFSIMHLRLSEMIFLLS